MVINFLILYHHFSVLKYKKANIVGKIIGIILVIAALVGGIFAGMQFSVQPNQKPKSEKPKEVNFQEKEFIYSKFKKPVIIPIFKNDRAVGMLIVEIWLELEPDSDTISISAKEPRIRDELMQVFYLYASEGRFSQDLLKPQTQAELRYDLTHVARQFIGDQLHAVLINDMQRQDLM
ncbi:MAG: flagellar basal body-associated protein FliL [Dasania sp.]|jgi:flagellar basal body-associated protein FliL